MSVKTMAGFTLFIAADMRGDKCNIEVGLKERPSLEELAIVSKQVLEWEAANIPKSGIKMNNIDIDSIMLLDDRAGVWMDKWNISHLENYGQIYVILKGVNDSVAAIPFPKPFTGRLVISSGQTTFNKDVNTTVSNVLPNPVILSPNNCRSEGTEQVALLNKDLVLPPPIRAPLMNNLLSPTDPHPISAVRVVNPAVKSYPSGANWIQSPLNTPHANNKPDSNMVVPSVVLSPREVQASISCLSLPSDSHELINSSNLSKNLTGPSLLSEEAHKANAQSLLPVDVHRSCVRQETHEFKAASVPGHGAGRKAFVIRPP